MAGPPLTLRLRSVAGSRPSLKTPPRRTALEAIRIARGEVARGEVVSADQLRAKYLVR